MAKNIWIQQIIGIQIIQIYLARITCDFFNFLYKLIFIKSDINAILARLLSSPNHASGNYT